MIRQLLAKLKPARSRKKFEYTNKVIVVTGGAGGIGSSFARQAATRGARIVIVDLDGVRAKGLVDQLPISSPGHLWPFVPT